MNRYPLLIVCLMMVPVVFLNVVCVPPRPPAPPPNGSGGSSVPPPPPAVHCSHRVGSVVWAGESITYKRTAADMSIEFTLKLEDGGFVYTGSGAGGTASTTSQKHEYCWGTECFIAEKNRDGSWTIKSLPFID